MAGKIQSNTVDAQGAITALTGLKDMSCFKTVDFGDSNVQAMLNGKQLANELIIIGRKQISSATKKTDTLQMEASGNQIRYSTLFCHAQDTLMTAQSEILIGEHMVRLFQNLAENNKQKNTLESKEG